MYLGSRSRFGEFSSFVEFINEADFQRVRWRDDIRLFRNIVRILESEDYKGVATTVIVLTFVKELQENYNPVIHGHLVAYLHKSCFKTCVAVFQGLKKLENFPENIELEQFFLEANSLLWQKDLLNRYNSQSASIKTYITRIVNNNLLDSVSKSLGDSGRRSAWGLLKESSKIKINRALNIVQISSSRNRSDYLNLINLYKDICGSTKGLKEGDSLFVSMMESIAEQFNLLSNVSLNGDIMNSQEVTEILKRCTQALRQLDSVQKEFSSNDWEDDIFDRIPSVETFSCVDELIDLISGYLNKTLEDALSKQCHETMKMNAVLTLHHGLGCKDREIGLIYKRDQSTFYRFRKDAYSPLIKVLKQCDSKTFLKEFDDPCLLKILKEVLDAIYQAKLNEMLHLIGKHSLQSSDLMILSDLYELRGNRRSQDRNLVQEIANKQNVSAEYIDEAIRRIHFMLSNALFVKLKELFDPSLSIDCIGNKIHKFVGAWIDIPKQ